MSTGTTLPIAGTRETWQYTRSLLARHWRPLALITVVNILAALAGMAGPVIFGRLVDSIVGDAGLRTIQVLVVACFLAVVLQAVAVRAATRRAMVLGERVFARVREEFVESVTSLPLSTVEAVGGGDLLARMTRDIDNIQQAVRFGVPRMVVAVVTIVLTVVVSVVVSPLVTVATVVGLPAVVLVTRWYLRRAMGAYRRSSAAYATMVGTLSESVEGAETVDALQLGARRTARSEDAIDEVYAAERVTLNLRTALMPGVDFTFIVVPVVVLVWGGYLAAEGAVTVGVVATIVMLTYQMQGPTWDLIFWLDEIQVAGNAMARIIGVRSVPLDRTPTAAVPADERVAGSGVWYAYRAGVDVLKGIDLDLRTGERLAIVGPSGAGKSTFGRMLAGIHPPTRGSVTVGGVPLVDLPLDQLRAQVALVTQEHHVFVGTIAENLRFARPGATDDELAAAVRAVRADRWVAALQDGLGTEVGSGGHVLTPAQAQQVALARLVLLNPRVLVLDEATSLLDPGAARELEQSLRAVLAGRTVVAIAHRLHTAHDADRVAVLDGGLITEIGSHQELIEADGDYARLWRSWHHG